MMGKKRKSLSKRVDWFFDSVQEQTTAEIVMDAREACERIGAGTFAVIDTLTFEVATLYTLVGPEHFPKLLAHAIHNGTKIGKEKVSMTKVAKVEKQNGRGV